MAWARRPERDTPAFEPRRFLDRDGRRWVGSVTSGSAPGGEEHAEILFVCTDRPSELKRVGRLDSPPAKAARKLRRMAEDELRGLLEASEPA